MNITVFERNSYVGGRSTTVYAYGDETQPLELGASIFVKVNRNLVNAANEFNLSTSGMRQVVSDDQMLGIWNGKTFVLVTPDDITWWDKAKLFWKYGLAPIKTLRLMKSTTAKFFKMYEAPTFPFKSLSDVVYDVGLTAVTAITGEQYLKKNGVGELFANEIIQASTRVNYAQNLDQIHGLEAMVCMATEGAMSVEGGNWQIFDAMLDASGAHVHLERQVGDLKKQEDGSYTIESHYGNAKYYEVGTDDFVVEKEAGQMVFDEVVLAAPNQYTGIKFDPEPKHMPDEIPYVNLHVTLFASKHLLAPSAFGLPLGETVPQVILTTTSLDGAEPRPNFQSISTLQAMLDPRRPNPPIEYAYKIFSMEPVNSTFLANILGLDYHMPDEEIDTSDISWIYRKLWQSYPYELPRVTFEEIKLDDKLWYTSGIESFISTMETSSLMGMNVARLMVDQWIESGV